MKIFPYNYSKFLFHFLLACCTNISFAQTWVKTSYWDNFGGQTIHNQPGDIGPFEIIKTGLNTIVSITRRDPDITNLLLNIPLSGALPSGAIISHSGGIFSESAGNLYRTTDSGYVYTKVHLNSPFDVVTLVKTGTQGSWSRTYSSFPYPNCVMPSSFGNSLIMFPDSTQEIDGNENILRTITHYTGSMYPVNDTDFIVNAGNGISRQDFNGNIRWHDSLTNGTIINVDTDYIYLKNVNLVSKIRTDNGNYVWQKFFGFTYGSVTHDGGLITTAGTVIQRFDSMGNQMWSRNITFPDYGFKNIIEASPNYFITGGAYRCQPYDNPSAGYSFFIMSIDSSGHGEIDSTSHFYNGNANDNNTFSFSDDGAYIGAAMGNAGPARLTILSNSSSRTVFGKDWPGAFTAGYNYKFSDYNGNGLIDSSDVINLSNDGFLPHTISPSWRLSAQNTNGHILKIKYSNDTVYAGNNITAYVTLGTDSISLDSVYSFSMTMFEGWNYNFNAATCNIQNSNFGIVGTNAYSYFHNLFAGLNFLLCRTDQQNTIISGDTVASFTFSVKPNAMEGKFQPYVWFNVISKDGYPLNLSLESDSVYINNPSTHVEILQTKNYSVFPNPSDNFKIELPEKIKEFLVFDITGKEIFRNYPEENFYNWNAAAMSPGAYYLQCITTKNIYYSKAIVGR